MEGSGKIINMEDTIDIPHTSRHIIFGDLNTILRYPSVIKDIEKVISDYRESLMEVI